MSKEHTIKVASVQWFVWVPRNIVPGSLAHSLVELELIYASCEVPHIAHVACHMVFAPRVKIHLTSLVWWSKTLKALRNEHYVKREVVVSP